MFTQPALPREGRFEQKEPVRRESQRAVSKSASKPREMLFLLALAYSTTPTASASALMIGRVLGSARITDDEWARTKALHRREIIVLEADGRKTRLRLTEFE